MQSISVFLDIAKFAEKCGCQENSRGVSQDSYIFWIFFR